MKINCCLQLSSLILRVNSIFFDDDEHRKGKNGNLKMRQNHFWIYT